MIHASHEYNSIVVIVGVTGILIFVSVLLFWFCHLNKTRIIQFMHPTSNILEHDNDCCSHNQLRSMTIYLFLNEYIHRDIYASLESFRAVVLDFGFIFVWYSSNDNISIHCCTSKHTLFYQTEYVYYGIH